VSDDGGSSPADASDGSLADADASVNPPSDGPVSDRASSTGDVVRPPQCSDAGAALLTFHPSNLPDALTLPDGIRDFTFVYPCTFDTDLPGWLINCNSGFGTETRFQVITLSDGREATVLFAQSLTINAGATLTVVGQRPLIIAVNGKAEVNGTITAASSATNSWPRRNQSDRHELRRRTSRRSFAPLGHRSRRRRLLRFRRRGNESRRRRCGSPRRHAVRNEHARSSRRRVERWDLGGLWKRESWRRRIGDRVGNIDPHRIHWRHQHGWWSIED
jgi:hypothetical protein